MVVGGVLLAALAFVQGQYLEQREQERARERERERIWDETVERRRQNPLQPARPAARKVVHKSRCEYAGDVIMDHVLGSDTNAGAACDYCGEPITGNQTTDRPALMRLARVEK